MTVMGNSLWQENLLLQEAGTWTHFEDSFIYMPHMADGWELGDFFRSPSTQGIP